MLGVVVVVEDEDVEGIEEIEGKKWRYGQDRQVLSKHERHKANTNSAPFMGFICTRLGAHQHAILFQGSPNSYLSRPQRMYVTGDIPLCAGSRVQARSPAPNPAT